MNQCRVNSRVLRERFPMYPLRRVDDWHSELFFDRGERNATSFVRKYA